MINVCFGIHDPSGNYCKYTAVAIRSLLCCTREAVRVFILHDKTLCESNRSRLLEICQDFNAQIVFLEISPNEEWKKLKALKTYSVGTLFRLAMVKMLPDDVERVIYLDSDVVVNIDILDLWKIDMVDNVIMGRKDLHHDNPVFREGISEDTYINAGVLLMDLNKIRKLDFENMVNSYLNAHPECLFLDQDAINVTLEGEKGVISEIYNSFTVLHRKENDDDLEERIYHFAGDHPRLDAAEKAFDRLFFKHLLETPWKMDDCIDYFSQMIKMQDHKLELARRAFYNMSQRDNLVFWGATNSRQYRALVGMKELAGKNRLFIDRQAEKCEYRFEGYPAKRPSFLREYSDYYVVVLAYNHFEEISMMLDEYGLSIGDDYIDCRDILTDIEGGRTVV